MSFHSVLFKNEGESKRQAVERPAFFGDLNLDQIVDAITAGKEAYRLQPFFCTPLREVDTIRYRQEVMQDVENPTLLASIKTFSEKMVVVRRYLAMVEKLDFAYHKKGWFLEAALVYCAAATELACALNQVNLRSRGLLAFRERVANYVHSATFEALRTEARKVKEGLRGVKYGVIIHSGRFSVRRYAEERDYGVEVESIFEKFKQGVAKNYLIDLTKRAGMNHIEAKILEFVARLYPEQFAALDQFCRTQGSFVDEALRTFDREIQFYVAYLDFVAKIKHKGLTFCYPQISAPQREVFARDSFDLALAHALLHTKQPLICNDFSLQGTERIIVVTGPNQGGKTTFARTFGQLHYLASLGCPVPGSQARLALFDQIFTHFEREEDIRNLRGKLQDDLVRIHDILARATPNSVLIVNEMFVSTTLKDAISLSKAIMARVIALDALCVWVTFIDELSSLSEKTVSVVSTVVPENPAVRTFKIIRKPADGLAYALSIAQRHRLTYEQIRERLQR